VNDRTIAGHSFRFDESVLNASGEPPPGSTGPAEMDDERPIGRKHRDQPKDTSSFHGSLLSVVWSQQDGAAASPDVVTLLRSPVMEVGRPVEEA
jgi:hypothetical protein